MASSSEPLTRYTYTQLHHPRPNNRLLNGDLESKCVGAQRNVLVYLMLMSFLVWLLWCHMASFSDGGQGRGFQLTPKW